MIKVKIKEEYKNKSIYVYGTLYDLSQKTGEQLTLIWNQNPEFRIFLEEVISIGGDEGEVLLNEADFKKTIRNIRKKK
jgi:hypothetical protein